MKRYNISEVHPSSPPKAGLRRISPEHDSKMDEPGVSLRQIAHTIDFAWSGEDEHKSIQRRRVIEIECVNIAMG